MTFPSLPILRAPAALALVGLLVAGQASGQPGGSAAACPSPLLARDHWAVQRVERLVALGLVTEFLPAQRSVPLYEVARALEAGAARARELGSPLAAMLEDWDRRLSREARGVERRAECAERGAERIAASGALAFAGRVGAGAPGLGQFEPDRTGTLPLPDRAGGSGELDLMLALGPHASMRAAPAAGAGGLSVPVLELTAHWRALAASVGRHPVGYGSARSGAVVFSGEVPVDRIEIQTNRPIEFGGVLSPLGVFTLHTFLGRLWESRHPGNPYFWGARAAIQPHRRLMVAVNRGAMFAGDPEHPVTAWNLVNMAIGRVAGIGFENQIVSVGGWIHLPTEALIPLTFHLEWGAEDAAGAWWAVPGRVAGLSAPALPGLPEVALGVEYTEFAASCCSNPPWYRHWSFPGAWASRDRPLAHPLGGAGSELLLHSQADVPGTGLSLDLRAFRRTRREENLFAPERAGASTGAMAELIWQVGSAADVRLWYSREEGQGWAEQLWQAGGRYFF